MKKMRKIFAVLLTLAMVLAMSIPTFAAGAKANITLSGDTLTKDTTIKYVQIVEPDTTGSTLGWKFSNDTIANAFINAFKVNDTSVKTADDAIKKLIISTPDDNAATGTINASSELGAALDSLKALATREDNISTTTDGVPSAIKDLDKAGLYLVTASATGYTYLPMLAYIQDKGLGNLVDASLTVKGSKDKVTKVIDSDESQSVSEGDEIGYTVTAEYPYYSADAQEKTFTATDNLTNATFKENSLEIKVAGVNTALVPGTDYTVNEYKDTASLQIAFNYNPNYAGKTVTIKYIAKVGAGEGDVVNNIKSNFDTDGDSVTSAKVTFTVIKEGKDDKKLPGAEFTLYEYSEIEKEGYTKVENASVIDTRTENASGTKTIWVKQVGDPQETSAEEATKGTTTFVGLDAQKTYCVQETNAPTGYKIQKDYHVLTGADSTTAEGSKVYTFNNFDNVTVTDENLSALPSTGGIGTTIFTIAGCLIMVTAAGLFFASRKKANK
jgi:fimbrial isopeptide formation D2 family protein/LPXTG-motif cell wall-anchored protein